MTNSEASVQYNDFKGTAAADISDFSNLNQFAETYGINPKNYVPQGISLYCGYDNFVHVSLLCEDIENSNKLISISLPEMSISEFLKQFKRLHIMLFKNFYNPEKEIEEYNIEELTNNQ